MEIPGRISFPKLLILILELTLILEPKLIPIPELIAISGGTPIPEPILDSGIYSGIGPGIGIVSIPDPESVPESAP